MSEILIKNSTYHSQDAAIVERIDAVIKVWPLDLAPYKRPISLTSERPISNMNQKFRYVKIDSPETVDVIFDGKMFATKYFEIMVNDPKSLSIKYHGSTQVLVNTVLGE